MRINDDGPHFRPVLPPDDALSRLKQHGQRVIPTNDTEGRTEYSRSCISRITYYYVSFKHL